MIGRRRFLTLTGAGLAAPFALRGGAHGQTVSLKLHHFLPAASNVHANFLAPWAASVQEASAGRIAIQIVPAMQLGGAPAQLYDQARDGIVDMAWTVAGYTPGRFPRLEAFDLPFVAAKRGVVNSQAIQDFADKHAAAELADVQPLVVWGQDHGVIHSKKPIAALADMKGSRLRAPTRLCGEALQALGATAVSMPATLVPEALAQGVIDGSVAPWELVPSIKAHELTGFHTEIPGSPTLCATVFLLVMNKASFGRLPENLRRVLLARSGQAGATMAGQAFDARNEEVKTMVRARGNTIASLAEDEKARWIEATRPVVAKWTEDSRARGIDGAAILAEARALIGRFDQPA